MVSTRKNQIQVIQYENVGLQGVAGAKDHEITALQRYIADFLANKYKNNGVTITAKSNEAAQYPNISI